jgi:hypothetical protein
MTITLEAETVTITTTNRLEELEAQIDIGLTTVWEAAKEIRDDRLFELRGFTTFDDYCRETFNRGRHAVEKLWSAAEVAKTLPSVNGVTPKPSHIRELERIEDEPTRSQAWQDAVETAPKGKVTAKHVAAVVAATMPKPAADGGEVATNGASWGNPIDEPEAFCPMAGEVTVNPGKAKLNQVVQQSAEVQLRELVQDIFNHPFADKRMVEDFLDRARELGVEYDV